MELGASVLEACQKIGISEAVFYQWYMNTGGLGPTKVQRLEHLEEENRRLKLLVADLSLEKAKLRQKHQLTAPTQHGDTTRL